MATTPMQFRDGNPELRQRAAALLARYPDIDENELAELRAFYSSAPPIDTALLTCDPALLPRINQFEADHEGKLPHQARLGPLLWVVFFCVALVAYAIWMGV